MSLAQKFPLMRTGETGRNAAVAIGYFVTIPLWVMLLPFIVFWRDYGGIATSLSGVPGISAGGGVVSGVVACVLCLVLVGLVSAALPGGDAPGQGDAGVDAEEPGATTDTPAPIDEPTSTATATPMPDSDKERAENALIEGYQASDSDYRDGVREVDTLDGYDGRDGYLIELRYDLFVDGFGNLEDDAEHRAGQVAVATLEAMADTNAENVTAVAIYAYVPTNNGDAVSTKIVIDMSTVESIDWNSYAWQSLRDDAYQYKFNDYLYN
ncbi:hypothetical protein [Halorarum salinum]|uniref:Uncharacterized protein n=1 Tax=Halorarum salinum TaxID=2743089 RepID=A0A7D5L924_9EURY|nr:hypothetical protein [Halobaculum salinum]QLG61073.1 hypothetical protein HUG12_04715 [Halobaculum salinum]